MASMAFATCNSFSTRFLAPPVCRKSRASTYLSTTTDKALTFLDTSSPKPFYLSTMQLGFTAKIERRIHVSASSNEGSSESETAQSDDANQARGQSTFPERFRYLTKEAPDRPVRWPWAIALVFLVYAWRTALWELSNWAKAVLAVIKFLGYSGKLLLAVVFHYIGGPVTEIIRCLEFCLYSAKYAYGSVVAFAPVPELMRIILFTTAVLAIAEAIVPDSVNNQMPLLTFAAFIGFGAVKNFIPEPLFWMCLCGLFCYSRFITKKDDVSAVLPSAAVLAAVGEPWVRILAIGSYSALAVIQHSKASKEPTNEEVPETSRRLPVPLLLAALSVGVHLAAKWVRYRHVTWMIA